MRSTEYMSMTINNQEVQRVQRLVWGKLFGHFIQKGREKRGCTVEETSRLAGMEPSNGWLLRPASFRRLRRSCA